MISSTLGEGRVAVTFLFYFWIGDGLGKVF